MDGLVIARIINCFNGDKVNARYQVEYPAEQGIIQDIRAMRQAGGTLQEIAEALTRRGVPTKTGRSTRWTHQAIARILLRLA